MSGVAKAIGGIAKGIGKAVGSVGKAVKNFVSADALKLAAIGAGVFFGGAALRAWPLPSFLSGGPGAAAGVGTTLSQTTGLAAAAAPVGPMSAALTAATTNPLLATTMASPVTAPMMSPVVAGATGQAVLQGAAGTLPAVAPPAATVPAAGPVGGTAGAAGGTIAAPKISPFWTHPATRMGGALLAGAMIAKGREELDKQRYKHERDLQRERLEARQIRYIGGSVRPSRLYKATIG